MNAWFAVYTAARAEARAAAAMADLGYHTFAPTYPAWVRLRHNSRRCVLKDKPLLQRYTFVQFDVDRDNWPAILAADGVESILSMQSTPIRIPDRQMAILRIAKSDPEILQLAKCGDLMRIIGGPFIGHLTRLTAVWNDKYRARGNVTLFDQPTPVDFDLADLETA